MIETSLPTEADLIALKKMFSAIADYGKKMRLCRQVGDDSIIQNIPDVVTQEEDNCDSDGKQRHRRRGNM